MLVPVVKQFYYFLILILLHNPVNSTAQNTAYGIIPAIPQPSQFQEININQHALSNKQPNINNSNFDFYQNSTIAEQNSRAMAEADKMIYNELNKENQAAFIQKELAEAGLYDKQRLEATKSYRNSFTQLNALNPDSFSIAKAIYLVENAFYKNQFSYEQFENAIQNRAELVKQILKREHIDPNNNLALNYGIQKLFSQANRYFNPKTKQTIDIPPLQYDFDDYMGEKDYRQLLVTKVIQTGKGQCHSMPLIYLAVAEQLGAKAYLSLAPQHSFIQFFDEQNNRLCFETTNGSLVSQNWLLQSGFINAAALKNKTYLDTLSQKKLFAQCLSDLLLSYLNNFGYDDFAEQVQQKIEQLDANNLTVKLITSNLKTHEAMNKIKAVGSPPVQQLPDHPEAYQAYLQMHESYKQVDDLGYQEMPKEAYQAWRKTIEKEKKQQRTKELQQQMQKEIEMLKKLRPTLIIPKG
ncbi:MAG: hypothetical protein IPJ81_00905 [Chitinophagaceae bacterium]|nr:hypothetical protein [Chitinophagaceae bacterium]